MRSLIRNNFCDNQFTMKLLLFIFCSIFVWSCSSQAVAVDYDRKQDFSQLKDYRYEFVENSMSELDINRLKNAIEQELGSRGMLPNEQSLVKIKIAPTEYISETQDSQVGIGVGGGSYGFGTSVGVNIPITSEKLNQQYKVSIFNSENQLIWDGRLDIQMPANAKPETVNSNVQKGVQKLFKNFPPKKN